MAGYNLSNSPGHLLRRAQQYAHDHFTRQVGSKGPTPRQFEVLHAVSKNAGLSQTDLVRITGIDRSTLADMIARMTKKGLLTRKRTKEDARANAVQLSAAGKRLLASVESKVVKAEKAALSVLSKTQQTAFTKALAAYARAIDETAVAPAASKGRKAAKKATKKKKNVKKGARKTTARKKTVRKSTRRKTK